jgi:hypothetical protein
MQHLLFLKEIIEAAADMLPIHGFPPYANLRVAGGPCLNPFANSSGISLAGYLLKTLAQHFARDSAAAIQGVGKLETRLQENEDLGKKITEQGENLAKEGKEYYLTDLMSDRTSSPSAIRIPHFG